MYSSTSVPNNYKIVLINTGADWQSGWKWASYQPDSRGRHNGQPEHWGPRWTVSRPGLPGPTGGRQKPIAARCANPRKKRGTGAASFTHTAVHGKNSRPNTKYNISDAARCRLITYWCNTVSPRIVKYLSILVPTIKNITTQKSEFNKLNAWFSVNMKVTKMESWNSTYFQSSLKWYSALYLPRTETWDGRALKSPPPTHWSVSQSVCLWPFTYYVFPWLWFRQIV